MKTTLLFLLAAFLFTTGAFAQDQKTEFDNPTLVKTTEGASYVQLNWKKGAENTNFYLVERSVNGKTFQQTALVFASDSPEFQNYNFRDKTVAAKGTVYYRIAIVDDQKNLTYLPVKSVRLTANGLAL